VNREESRKLTEHALRKYKEQTSIDFFKLVQRDPEEVRKYEKLVKDHNDRIDRGEE
jgi:hypothetical protein